MDHMQIMVGIHLPYGQSLKPDETVSRQDGLTDQHQASCLSSHWEVRQRGMNRERSRLASTRVAKVASCFKLTV